MNHLAMMNLIRRMEKQLKPEIQDICLDEQGSEVLAKQLSSSKVKQLRFYAKPSFFDRVASHFKSSLPVSTKGRRWFTNEDVVFIEDWPKNTDLATNGLNMSRFVHGQYESKILYLTPKVSP